MTNKVGHLVRAWSVPLGLVAFVSLMGFCASLIELEYGALTVYGAAAGALIGAGASRFFAPFFTITGEKDVPLPPLIPIIAQDALMGLAAGFAAMMVVIAAIVIATADSDTQSGTIGWPPEGTRG